MEKKNFLKRIIKCKVLTFLKFRRIQLFSSPPILLRLLIFYFEGDIFISRLIPTVESDFDNDILFFTFMSFLLDMINCEYYYMHIIHMVMTNEPVDLINHNYKN